MGQLNQELKLQQLHVPVLSHVMQVARVPSKKTTN